MQADLDRIDEMVSFHPSAALQRINEELGLSQTRSELRPYDGKVYGYFCTNTVTCPIEEITLHNRKLKNKPDLTSLQWKLKQ